MPEFFVVLHDILHTDEAKIMFFLWWGVGGKTKQRVHIRCRKEDPKVVPIVHLLEFEAICLTPETGPVLGPVVGQLLDQLWGELWGQVWRPKLGGLVWDVIRIRTLRTFLISQSARWASISNGLIT
jgi:hypothetical protein